MHHSQANRRVVDYITGMNRLNVYYKHDANTNTAINMKLVTSILSDTASLHWKVGGKPQICVTRLKNKVPVIESNAMDAK